jgi:hypothetical protein
MGDGPSRVHALVVAGRAEEAVVEAARQLLHAPEDPELLLWAGIAHGEVGEHAVAVDLTGRAVSLEPSNARYHRVLATLLNATRRTRDAITEAGAAVRLAPDDASGWITLAEVSGRGKLVDRRDGRAAAQRAIELAPHSAAAWNALAINSFGRRRTEALHRALELDPHLKPARLNLARHQRRVRPAGEVQAALDLAREAPGDRGAHLRVLAIAGARRQARWLLLAGAVMAALAVGSRDVVSAGWATFLLAVGVWRLIETHGERSTLNAVADDAQSRLVEDRRRRARVAGPPAWRDERTRPARRRRAGHWVAFMAAGAVMWVVLSVVEDHLSPSGARDGAMFGLGSAVMIHSVFVVVWTWKELVIWRVLATRPWVVEPATDGTVILRASAHPALRFHGEHGPEVRMLVHVTDRAAVALCDGGEACIADGRRFSVVLTQQPPRLVLVRPPWSVETHARWASSFRAGTTVEAR